MEKWTYIGERVLDGLLARVEVEREHFAGVDDERDDARGDEDGDEERRDWVEACPAVELNEERRDDHADRTQSVLQKRFRRGQRVKEEKTHGHDVQEDAAHIVRVALLCVVVHMRVVVEIWRAVCVVRREVLVVPELVVRGDWGDRPVEQVRLQT